MSQTVVASHATGALALAMMLLCSADVGQAEPAAPYAKMAPITQYLMTDDAEIALAKSAAPKSISGDATVVVLKRTAMKQR